MRALLSAVAVLGLLAAGCLEDPSSNSDKNVAKKGAGGRGAVSTVGALLVPQVEGLWYDPETTPHPAFNFPTLTHPPTVISNPWLNPIPMGKMPAKITGLKQVAKVEGAPSGAGMSLIGSLAILPSGSGTRYVDISDPTHPKVVGSSQGGTRGSDTIVYPDGRIFAVMATGGPIMMFDITNPASPGEGIQLASGRTHKVDVVPGTPIIYNSASGDIWDATNPEAAVKLEKTMPDTCHRTYFYIEPTQDYYRAICAGYDQTHLWDISDPRDPKVVVSINMWHARSELPPSSVTPVTFSHFAILSDDHKTLIVGDEMGGGAAMACGASATVPGTRTVSQPTGALWFFDVSNEKQPALKSWLSPPAPTASNPPPNGGASCTAHHGRLVPDPEGKRDFLAMGFYGAGVILVDFTDPASPYIMDQFNDGTSVWEAWYYNGYVFTGDGRRGLDAIGFE